MRKECTLESALDYKNEDVVYRFLKVYNITKEECSILFEETKKWLWLCYKATEPKSKISLIIDDSILIIDEMWHNFILFTNDYKNYCLDKFGFYIHHQPTTKNEILLWRNNPEQNSLNYLEDIENQYSNIYDLLGKETLILWYKDFAKKYTKEIIKDLLI